MGLFSNILEKLGIKKTEAPVAKPSVVIPSTKAGELKTGPTPSTKAGDLKADKFGAPLVGVPGSARPAEMPMVDVVAKLDSLAKGNPEKLDWKVSIVDMLKLLGIDSSLASRKELAVELGCPAEKMSGDYAQMNVWLHKEVLRRISANGGNVPQNLLD